MVKPAQDWQAEYPSWTLVLGLQHAFMPSNLGQNSSGRSKKTLENDHGIYRDDKDRRSSSAVRWIGRSR
jgi:hypothetical protein